MDPLVTLLARLRFWVESPSTVLALIAFNLCELHVGGHINLSWPNAVPKEQIDVFELHGAYGMNESKRRIATLSYVTKYASPHIPYFTRPVCLET